jgi:hypothetical protein
MMELKGFASACVLMAAALCAAQASAQVIANPTAISNILRANSLKVTADTDSGGDPRLTIDDDGTKYQVWFYGCTDHKECSSIQFYAGFTGTKMTPDTLNIWNRKNRFGRAYIDSDGDPAIEMDVDLDKGGMSADLFQDNLEFWNTTMSNFSDYVFDEKSLD